MSERLSTPEQIALQILPLIPTQWGPSMGSASHLANRIGQPAEEVVEALTAMLLGERPFDSPLFELAMWCVDELGQRRWGHDYLAPTNDPRRLVHRYFAGSPGFEARRLAAGVAALQALEVKARLASDLQVTVDEIHSFSEVRKVTPDAVADILDQGYLDISEDRVQTALEEILVEPWHKKDWGGEIDDLYTNNVVIANRRLPAAFLLKGNGLRSKMMHLNNCGARGDQVVRLFTAPAELFVVQFVGNVAENLAADVRGKARERRYEGKPAQFCIMNGQDTARVLRAYGKL